MSENREGEVFKNNRGLSMVVIKYHNARNVVVRFDSGCEKTVLYEDVKRGEVKDDLVPYVQGVGYVGMGEYGSRHKAYAVWKGMLQRCYCEKFKQKYPTYEGKYVDPSWHNFQNFAKWFEQQTYRQDGWCLDKDIILKGNNLYGPEVCCFVPNEVNTAVIKTDVSIYFNESRGKFIAQCRGMSGKRYLGSYDTKQEAEESYKEAKKLYLNLLADKYEEELPSMVIRSLRQWMS